MTKLDILSLNQDEIKNLMSELSEPAYRAKQVYAWLHKERTERFEDMLNLPLPLRQKLSDTADINGAQAVQVLRSRDGTKKYLMRLFDGEHVESVLMRYKHGNTICISTQAGCRMGCSFCASTKSGLKRNLTAGEMLGQIYAAQREDGERISGAVLMGIGEPLDNYDNVLSFLRAVSSPDGYNMGARHISLSTCGLVDRMYDLMRENLQITLSVSLHAPDDELRKRLMPVARRYPMNELLKACKDYTKATGRRISFEYTLINGENDSEAHAAALAQRLKGMLCHVNLIPVNSIKDAAYRSSNDIMVERFLKVLTSHGINATVRRRLGTDIEAACGQLRQNNGGIYG